MMTPVAATITRRTTTMTYQTADVQIAAALLAQDYKLASVTRQGRRAIFNFDDDGSAERTVFEFLSGKAIPGKRLLDSLKSLKILLHPDRDGYGN